MQRRNSDDASRGRQSSTSSRFSLLHPGSTYSLLASSNADDNTPVYTPPHSVVGVGDAGFQDSPSSSSTAQRYDAEDGETNLTSVTAGNGRRSSNYRPPYVGDVGEETDIISNSTWSNHASTERNGAASVNEHDVDDPTVWSNGLSESDYEADGRRSVRRPTPRQSSLDDDSTNSSSLYSASSCNEEAVHHKLSAEHAAAESNGNASPLDLKPFSQDSTLLRGISGDEDEVDALPLRNEARQGHRLSAGGHSTVGTVYEASHWRAQPTRFTPSADDWAEPSRQGHGSRHGRIASPRSHRTRSPAASSDSSQRPPIRRSAPYRIIFTDFRRPGPSLSSSGSLSSSDTCEGSLYDSSDASESYTRSNRRNRLPSRGSNYAYGLLPRTNAQAYEVVGVPREYTYEYCTFRFPGTPSDRGVSREAARHRHHGGHRTRSVSRGEGRYGDRIMNGVNPFRDGLDDFRDDLDDFRDDVHDVMDNFRR